MSTLQVNLQEASFDPTTGILRTERDHTVEYIRIPRTARLIVQLFNGRLTMWFHPTLLRPGGLPGPSRSASHILGAREDKAPRLRARGSHRGDSPTNRSATGD